MKKIIVLIIVLVNSTNIYSLNIFGKVKLDNEWTSKVYLAEINKYYSFFNANSSLIIDSTKIDENGNFIFKNISSEKIYRIQVQKVQSLPGNIIQNGINDNYYFLYSSSNINLTFNIKNLTNSIKIEKNLVQNKVDAIFNYRRPVLKLLEEFQTNTTPKTSTSQDELLKNLNVALDNGDFYLKRIIEKEQNPMIKIFAIALYDRDIKIDNDINFIKKYNNFFNKYSSNKLISNYLDLLNKAKEVYLYNDLLADLKSDIVDINQLNTLNKDYILFDCWASWCVPCRFEIKNNLPKVSEKFNEQLTIYGINFDDDVIKFESAIKQDKNNFIQLKLKNNFQSKISQKLKIKNIPYYFLIDTKNKIVYKNISLSDLEKLIK